MRLIDADALKPLLREYCVDDDEVVMKWYDIMGVDEVVDRAPTIDAVPVVRCKDCKCWTYEAEGDFGIKYGFCEHADFPASVLETTHGDFCSYGERSE